MLLLLDKGVLRKATRRFLRERNVRATLGKPSAGDLFERAVGCGTILYAPASNLLAASLDPRPDPDRMRAVLRAANAPGCSTLVVVVPSAESYEPELDVLRREGKPYVIVTAPPLLEEIGLEIARAHSGSLWIPRAGEINVARASDVARALFDASETEYQGRTETVASTRMDLASAFQEAAQASNAPVRVHAVWAPLHRAIRPVARWLRGGEPNALSLALTLEQRAILQTGT